MVAESGLNNVQAMARQTSGDEVAGPTKKENGELDIALPPLPVFHH